jgi:hypothetical protein
MRGRSVKDKLANLLARRDPGGEGTPQHQAAVFPAKSRDMKVIDANIADE